MGYLGQPSARSENVGEWDLFRLPFSETWSRTNHQLSDNQLACANLGNTDYHISDFRGRPGRVPSGIGTGAVFTRANAAVYGTGGMGPDTLPGSLQLSVVFESDLGGLGGRVHDSTLSSANPGSVVQRERQIWKSGRDDHRRIQWNVKQPRNDRIRVWRELFFRSWRQCLRGNRPF